MKCPSCRTYNYKEKEWKEPDVDMKYIGTINAIVLYQCPECKIVQLAFEED